MDAQRLGCAGDHTADRTVGPVGIGCATVSADDADSYVTPPARKVPTMAADPITIERAMSDYLAVSRNAHRYAIDEYERVEAAAWERLQALLPGDGADALGADLQPAGA